MSVVVKTKQVTTTEIVVESRIVTCDMCGVQSPLPLAVSPDGEARWGPIESRWKESATSVTIDVGYNTRDGGSGTKTIWHICPSCFDELSDYIRAKRGAEPSVQEWDW